MTEKTSNQSLVDNLVVLKAQYESELTEAGSKATYYKEQLVHLNALLLDRLLPSQEFRTVQPLEQPEPVLAFTVQDESPNDRPSLPPASKAKADSQAPASRVSLPFLPKYKGKKKLEAIGEVMQAHVGEVLHQDTIIQLLFGDLSPAALKTERLRMKTALLQGVKKGFWSKAPKPSSYILKASKAKAEQAAPAAARSKSAPKAASKAAPAKSRAAQSTTGPGRKTKAPKTSSRSVAAAKAKASPSEKPARGRQAAKTKAPGQSPRIILPMHSDFTGLSKIEAVEKVMAENAGNPVHIDTIIDRLFGKLSGPEAKAEKGRMKDVMNRGRDRKLWNKSPCSAQLCHDCGFYWNC
ncbi:MAG: hypothetical protein HC852_11870 [Acaryochloridaceae cyanobacterium RU_4_10]|nr:hypothetical protein [Acaryochloridaceae cyanobacterium RU_4_10]